MKNRGRKRRKENQGRENVRIGISKVIRIWMNRIRKVMILTDFRMN